MSKIVLLGASGYIGQQFAQELIRRDIQFFEIHRNIINYYDPDVLFNFLETYQPDFLINCAGWAGQPTNRDQQTNTYIANTILPKVLSEACGATTTPRGHVSSGCIFHGQKKDGTPFNEEDETDCCLNNPYYSLYNATKAEGERMIKAVGRDYYIWRLRMPFDEFDHPKNYISKLLYKYDKLYDSPENSICHRGDFVSACLDIWLNKCDYGIYNVVNSGSVTAREVIEKINKNPALSKSFDFFKTEKEFYKFGAKAPRSNCILDNSKLISSGINIRHVHEALEKSIENWKKQ